MAVRPTRAATPMCGRFTLTSPAAVLERLFDVALPAGLAPRYNVAPTQDVLVVRRGGEGAREAALLRWGLVPSWAKDASIGNRLINARSETAAEKPSFRSAMKRRRCLVAADGFYEWAALEGAAKRPFLIRLESGEPFAFAGLWERWRGGDEALETCTILTTDANARLEALHDRMPVILDRADHERWLGGGDPGDPPPADLLRPFDPARMTFFPVSRRVNSPRHDDPSLVEPAGGDDGPQGSLPLDPGG